MLKECDARLSNPMRSHREISCGDITRRKEGRRRKGEGRMERLR